MRNICCLNQISHYGTDRLTGDYKLVDDIKDAEGILVRSASLHETEFPARLQAIARAGAGVNNIPLDVCAEKDGFISFLEAQKLGLASKALGAGRSTKDAPVDYAVGIVLHKQVGDAVSAGEVLATLYINDKAELGQAMEMLRSAIVVSDKKPAERPLIYETIE